MHVSELNPAGNGHDLKPENVMEMDSVHASCQESFSSFFPPISLASYFFFTLTDQLVVLPSLLENENCVHSLLEYLNYFCSLGCYTILTEGKI